MEFEIQITPSSSQVPLATKHFIYNISIQVYIGELKELQMYLFKFLLNSSLGILLYANCISKDLLKITFSFNDHTKSNLFRGKP
jgi:hypothetical protein